MKTTAAPPTAMPMITGRVNTDAGMTVHVFTNHFHVTFDRNAIFQFRLDILNPLIELHKMAS